MSEYIVLHTYRRRSACQAKTALLMCIGLSWASVGYRVDPEFGKPLDNRIIPGQSQGARLIAANKEVESKLAKIGQIEFPFETLLRERDRRRQAAEFAERQREMGRLHRHVLWQRGPQVK